MITGKESRTSSKSVLPHEHVGSGLGVVAIFASREDFTPMEKVPKYLMDEKGFYWNPKCPDNHVNPAPGYTIDDLRIPVRLFSSAGECMPGDELPRWVAEAGVLTI